MQYLEFKIYNLALERMGGGDPVKQMKERTAYLDNIRKEAEEKEKAGTYQYASTWNPFPEFVRNIIKEMAVEKHSKVRYDDENSVYKVRIDGGRMEYDEFYDDFNKRFNIAKDTAQDDPEWWKDNVVRITSTPDDEVAAMNDLESHQRNAALPVNRKTQPEAD